jgi:RNA polymerase sigma-70 factor (ECF subfamily)
VVANIQGPQAGLAAVSAIEDLDKLESYYLLYAAMGEFEERLNHAASAAGYFRKALELAELKSEKAFLARRLRECEGKMAGVEVGKRV